MDVRVFVLNAMASGIDTLNLIVNKIPIKGVIGLERSIGIKNSNYGDSEEWANRFGIPYISVKSYSLKDENENEYLRKMKIDILIVLGWQRLIPEWLIQQSRYGVIGLHGSPWGITKGRGRSPQNWAIILGEKKFELSAFLMRKGADDGPILATKTFSLDEADDIVSSYVKTSILYAQMIVEVVPKLTSGWKGEQQVGDPEYLPQRCWEDGQIDWQWDSVDITRQVRALTAPYPGAWTNYENDVIYLWRVQPINIDFDEEAMAGTVLTVFPQIPAFLVKTGDGAILVRDWEYVDQLTGNKTKNEFKGNWGNRILGESFSGFKQMQIILTRHQEKESNQKISKPLLKWMNKYRIIK